MIKMMKLAGVGLVTLGLGSSVAFAGDFSHADSNSDGMISYAEAFGLNSTMPTSIFASADANHDGMLDEGEFESLFGLGFGPRNK